MLKKAIVFICIALSFCIMYACQSALDIEQAKYVANGKDLYAIHCQNCHGVNGEGLGNLVPPLTDTLYLKNNKQKLACIIKNGANEVIIINGKTYEEKMPGFNQLEDIDIAQIITYISNSFGNKQGMYPYQKVADDLKRCN